MKTVKDDFQEKIQEIRGITSNIVSRIDDEMRPSEIGAMLHSLDTAISSLARINKMESVKDATLRKVSEINHITNVLESHLEKPMRPSDIGEISDSLCDGINSLSSLKAPKRSSVTVNKLAATNDRIINKP